MVFQVDAIYLFLDTMKKIHKAHHMITIILDLILCTRILLLMTILQTKKTHQLPMQEWVSCQFNRHLQVLWTHFMEIELLHMMIQKMF